MDPLPSMSTLGRDTYPGVQAPRRKQPRPEISRVYKSVSPRLGLSSSQAATRGFVASGLYLQARLQPGEPAPAASQADQRFQEVCHAGSEDDREMRWSHSLLMTPEGPVVTAIKPEAPRCQRQAAALCPVAVTLRGDPPQKRVLNSSFEYYDSR